MKIGRSPGLRLVVDLPIPTRRDSGIVDNNKLGSLQLREQLWILTKFPFNAMRKNSNRNPNSDANIKQKRKYLHFFLD
jgi:hypothetical protein